MRDGARPRRKSPVAAPRLPEPPEDRPPEDEFAAEGGEDDVELLVRVPIEALRGEPIAPIEPPDAGPEVESGETPGVAAVPEAAGKAPAGKAPAGKAPAGESDPGNGFFGVLVEGIEPPEADAAVEPGFEPVRAAALAVADPATETRFARLHLRTGALLQARSEYEALAANDLLNVPATLDLAEVRWRTGDLIGAGTAAAAYLAADGEEALGFMIAAEAAAAHDQMTDARRHAERALERSVANLEAFFAGVPRRMNWSESTWTAPAAMKIDTSSPAVAPERAVPAPVMAEPPAEASGGSPWVWTEELPTPTPAPEAPEAPAVEPAVVQEPVEAEPPAVEPAVAPAEPVAVEQHKAPESEAAAIAAAELPAPEPEPEVQSPAPEPHPWDVEVAAGTSALQGGDALMAALHFGVALRMTPESARAVVDGIGERRDLALQLVRGDALRLLGNESDAGEAYASVASALGKPRDTAQAPAPEPPLEPAPPQASAPQPAALASEPAAPAPKAASSPERVKKPKVDEPSSIRWE